MNTTMRRLGGATAAVAALITGCGTAPHSVSPPTASQISAPAARPCLAQVLTWRTGAVPMLQAVERDMSRVATAGLAGDLGGVQSAGTDMSGDIQVARTKLPPTCVPNMRTDYTVALNDWSAAADSANEGTLTGVQNATMQIKAGSKAIVRATTDLTAWEATQ